MSNKKYKNLKTVFMILVMLAIIVPTGMLAGCGFVTGNVNGNDISTSKSEFVTDEVTGIETENNPAETSGEEKTGDSISENTQSSEEQTDSETTAEPAEAPSVKLEITEGPKYAQEGQICYYRVKAIATGKPYPILKFNKDDSNGSWGSGTVQVNLIKDEVFNLACTATNTEGTASASIELGWVDDPNGTSQTTALQDPEVDFTNPVDFNIDVNISQQRVYIYYRQNLLKTLICSTGKPETPTPLGNFTTNQKIYYSFVPKFDEAAYYWTRFYGAYLFHSVPYDANGNLLTGELEKIGTPASHGCVRLYLEDAKWMYENLPLGINVSIHN
jgi:hypothetical protein